MMKILAMINHEVEIPLYVIKLGSIPKIKQPVDCYVIMVGINLLGNFICCCHGDWYPPHLTFHEEHWDMSACAHKWDTWIYSGLLPV
eukprot:9681825-Ditylum_brightwellii.AAC.1